jgi:erythromycin esterase-like protein
MLMSSCLVHSKGPRWTRGSLRIISTVRKPTRIADAQRLAWFGLWQTEAMAEIMKYVASTQTSANPLYLTSFDAQPGSSNWYQSNSLKALDAFFQAVAAYAPPPRPGAFDQWKSAFTPYLVRCYVATAAHSEGDRKVMDESLAEMSDWLRAASTLVRPAIHGRALLAVVASFHASMELCGIAATHPFATQSYQRIRDRENAFTALAIKNEVSASGKIILWAHHSHVTQDTLGATVPSMGRSLHESLGNQLYTIGLFAQSGNAIPASGGGLKASPLRPPEETEIDAALGHLADYDYFLDLSSRDLPEVFHRRANARFELTAMTPYVLAHDFSAVIVIQTVHPPVLALRRPPQ